MLALLSYWNLDLSNMAVLNKSEMSSIDNAQEMAEQLTSSQGLYQEVGTVYQDPQTGELYLLTRAQEATSAATTDTAQ